MRQIMDLSGGVLASVRAYELAPTTAVTAGMVVKLEGGLVVAAEQAETNAILGYAAENHGGVDDAFDLGASGNRILVEDGPLAVAESPAPVLIASGGTSTTVRFDAVAAFAANTFQGGRIKGPGGIVRTVTASAVESGVLTLTVPAGAAAVAGEPYALFPPVGFCGGNLDEARGKLILTATAALPIQVMGRDEGRNMIWTTAVKHTLAPAR